MAWMMDTLPGITATSYQDPMEWLEVVLQLRSDHEILCLDQFQDVLTMVLGSPTTGVLQQVNLTIDATQSVSVPRPSRHGVGEIIWAQDLMSEALPHLEWDPPTYDVPAVRGKGVFTFPLGPVRADVAEALLYRLAVMGDEIVRLDLVHEFKRRHVAALACGRTIFDAAIVVERLTGTSTVAHALAYSLAVEDALGIAVPDGISTGRMILAELERAYSHLGDLAALAVSTGLPVPQMEYLHHREAILGANFRLFGHRYLRGIIRPAGLDSHRWPSQRDLGREAARLLSLVKVTARIQEDLLHTPSYLDRLSGAGRIPPDTIDFVRPVGPVGRAAGRDHDVRGWRPYAQYSTANLTIPHQSSADALARYRVKSEELQQSLALLVRLLETWDATSVRGGATLEMSGADGGLVEGIGVVEAPRGQLTYRVVIDTDTRTIRHVGIATPSARNWYVVPPAIANQNILQDFPIIDASFSLSVAGWDG